MRVHTILLILLSVPLVLLVFTSVLRAEGSGSWGSDVQSWNGGRGRSDDRNPPSSHYDAFMVFSDTA